MVESIYVNMENKIHAVEVFVFTLVTQRCAGYSYYSKRVHIRIWQFLLKIVFFSGYKMCGYWEKIDKNINKIKITKFHQHDRVFLILTYLGVVFICV